MKTVQLKIDNHCDRMEIIKALWENGYGAGVKVLTNCIPPKTIVYVEVEDNEVVE